MVVKVAQLCLTLCYPVDHTVHGILQARTLEWVAFLFFREFPNPGFTPRSSHGRWILYQLSHNSNHCYFVQGINRF